LLVDVVAGVKEEIEPLFRDSRERGEEAGLVVVAAAHGEAKLVHRRAGRRRRLRPPDLADLSAGAESIPLFPGRAQPLHVDVHAVTELRTRDGDAVAVDRPEA